MGGINGLQMGKTLGIDKYTLPNINEILAKHKNQYYVSKPEELSISNHTHKPKILIVTAALETQVFSSMHALQCFYQLGYKVRFVNMPDRYHMIYPDITNEIWEFFEKI